MTIVMWVCPGCKRVCRETITPTPIACAGCGEPFQGDSHIRSINEEIESMANTCCPNCGDSWDKHVNGTCVRPEYPLEYHERGYQALMRGEGYDA